MTYPNSSRYGKTGRITRRSSRGSVIAEGAVAMCMVVTSSVLATLLIMNSFFLIFYKTKLTHIGYLAAAYAAAHDGDNGLEQETTDFTKSTMTQMNLVPNNLTVSVKAIRLEENSAVQVTIANEFPIAGISTGSSGSNLKIEDTEVASH